MTEIQRLAAAIKKISEVYLTRVVISDDREAIAKWTLRLADYSTRLAVLVSPPLAMREVAEMDVPEPLSSDPGVARASILAAIGHPITFDETGATNAIDPEAVLADASPQQQRELALLGFFGTPNGLPNVDYSLALEYFELADDQGNWKPKEPYMNTGTWQAYVAAQR